MASFWESLEVLKSFGLLQFLEDSFGSLLGKVCSKFQDTKNADIFTRSHSYHVGALVAVTFIMYFMPA